MVSLLKNRKIIYAFLICLLSFEAFSQTNTFPANGNAGIGVLSPDSKLHVVGDLHHTGTIGGNGAYHNVLKTMTLSGSPAYFYINTNIRATDNAAPQIQITGYMYGSTNKAMKITLGWYHYQNNFFFSQYQSDLGYQKPSRVRLGKYTKSDGNVYIRIEISNNSVYWANYTVSATDIFDDIAAYSGWTYDLGEMPTATTSEMIEVQQQQYVEKLDVTENVVWAGNNSGNPRALKLGYSGGNYGGLGYNVDFTNTTGLFNRPIADNSSYLEFTSGGFKFFGNANNNKANGINANGGGDNLNLLATITNAGNLGIGTTSPTEKLSVKGKIRAQEIKVETANWPDYVFEDNYKLNSLAEIEAYVKKYKHLSEMPSATQVAENGIELGEMNKLLLKKVEELTLLLIQKDKEMVREKNINIDQNRMIEELAKRVDLIIKK